MTRNKKLVVVTIILLAVGYISKPDRGGVGRCARIFAIPELHQIHLTQKPFYGWEPFESSKFCFRISPSEFSKLDAILKTAGYSEWETGGVTFGSVSHGHTPEEDYVYCKSTHLGDHYFWSYSVKEGLIYAITFHT